MKTFRTRQDLIDFAAANAPTNACERAIREQGRITVFGGIKSPEGFPGWLVDVEGKWLIGIWINDAARKIQTSYPELITRQLL